MDVSALASRLILLPHLFNSSGNESVYDLLKNIGYFEMHEQVAEEEIYEALTQHPECIDEWMAYAEDKRSTSGWYFKRKDEGEYNVGNYGGKDHKEIIYEFSDRMRACAFFIKHESENIRKI